jgi:hypothetical protein
MSVIFCEITRHVLVWYYASMSSIQVVYGSLTTSIIVLLSVEIAASGRRSSPNTSASGASDRRAGQADADRSAAAMKDRHPGVRAYRDACSHRCVMYRCAYMMPKT